MRSLPHLAVSQDAVRVVRLSRPCQHHRKTLEWFPWKRRLAIGRDSVRDEQGISSVGYRLALLVLTCGLLATDAQRPLSGHYGSEVHRVQRHIVY